MRGHPIHTRLLPRFPEPAPDVAGVAETGVDGAEDRFLGPDPDQQHDRLDKLFAGDRHLQVE
ncbi:hypothetical protein AUCHE_08_00910 [Austwickia chelonae NBRC 105200]|uniref:Uncharacterized protein n=1 Tax=Austwickia chelonae NBRC 105200 TaxID=1184607 RepID=K6VM72_9MICO|nr:hypothetical protein AUCHE_08_00910 [Austwickia chelonae NBRC 105200]